MYVEMYTEDAPRGLEIPFSGRRLFQKHKSSRMVSFQHSEGDGIMCTCVCVQVCKREGEAGEERGSGVKGDRGETGW